MRRATLRAVRGTLAQQKVHHLSQKWPAHKRCSTWRAALLSCSRPWRLAWAPHRTKRSDRPLHTLLRRIQLRAEGWLSSASAAAQARAVETPQVQTRIDRAKKKPAGRGAGGLNIFSL